MNNMESQIQDLINVFGERDRLPRNAITATLIRSAIYDDYEVRLNMGEHYTLITISTRLLQSSARGEARMIHEMIKEGYDRLIEESGMRLTLESFDETLRNVYRNMDMLSYAPFMGIDRGVDATRLSGLEAWIPNSAPTTPTIKKPDIKEKIENMLADMRSWIVSLEDKDILDEWDGHVEELVISCS